MYFILAILFLLFLILSLIAYNAVKESLVPMLLRSEHAVKFNQRISRAILQLMIDVKNDVSRHLETICEPDGDEPFEPFMDSPLRTCPPTEYIFSPPKEEIGTNNYDGVDGNNNNLPNIRRPRRRRVVPPPPQQRHPNPAVIIERIPFQQNADIIPAPVQNLLAVFANQRRNRMGPRRVLQLRELDGLISPPPQQNPHNNLNEHGVFQFD